MDAVIGMMQVDPAEVTDDGEYIVEGPAGSRVLTVGWADEHMIFWVAVPTPLRGEVQELTKYRFWILPGGRVVNIHSGATYLGPVISRDPDGNADHDWHVFLDTSGAPVPDSTQPQATYPTH